MSGGVRVRRAPDQAVRLGAVGSPDPVALEIPVRCDLFIHAGKSQCDPVVENIGDPPQDSPLQEELPHVLILRVHKRILPDEIVEKMRQPQGMETPEAMPPLFQRVVGYIAFFEVCGVFQCDRVFVKPGRDQARRRSLRIRGELGDHVKMLFPVVGT